MGDFHDRLAADLVGGAQERFVAELTERAARMLADAVANRHGTLGRMAGQGDRRVPRGMGERRV